MTDRPKGSIGGTAREDSEENEAIMPRGELGMVQAELIRLGKNVRADLAEIRSEFRSGLAELRKDNDARSQEIVALRIQVNSLPTSDRIRELEDRINESRETAGEVHRIVQWVDGTNGENGAAERLDKIRQWQSWVLGGMAVLGGLGALALVVFGAWFTSYLDRREKEHATALQQMISTQIGSLPAAPVRHPNQ